MQIRHQLLHLLPGDLVDRQIPEHRCDPQAQIDLDLGQGVGGKHAGARAHPLLGKRTQASRLTGGSGAAATATGRPAACRRRRSARAWVTDPRTVTARVSPGRVPGTSTW